jgi:hypothetical protein
MGKEHALARAGLLAAVLLGLGVRAWLYALAPSVWHDEAALIVNVLGKDFSQLFGSLYLAEAAPPLFLALLKVVCLLLGEGVLALRLVPFAASCAALVLVAVTARRALGVAAAAWAALLFAGSEKLLWHAGEAKPYGVDVLVAAGLAWLHARRMDLTRRLLLLAGLAPVIIFLCWPGCFLFGGVLVALLPAVWRASGVSCLVFRVSSIAPLTPRCSHSTPNTKHQTPNTRPGPLLAYALLSVIVFTSFTVLAVGPVRAQRCGPMDACWVEMFPDWHRPWSVPGWVLLSSVNVVDYCCRLVGPLLAGLALLGAVRLARAKQRSLLALLVVPVGLALVAACLGKYPYGGARVMAYAAPAVVLLVGAGTPAALAWLRARQRLVALALAGVLVFLAPLALYRAINPWQRADCAAASDHVLARLEPGDVVTSNHWEDLYYFRRLGLSAGMFDFHTGRWLSLVPTSGPAHYRMVERTRQPSGRRWVVCTAAVAPEDRLECARGMAGGAGRIVAQWEYRLTTVLLIEREAGSLAGR